MSDLHVLLRLADAEYALPADQVLHLESFTSATRVPGAPPYVAGLVQIRRRVVPVVDLRARFGLPPAEPTLASRVAVVQSGERVVGLLVDSAREVVNVPPAQLHPPPDLLVHQAAGYVRAVARVRERLVMLIDVDKVMGEESLHGGQ